MSARRLSCVIPSDDVGPNIRTMIPTRDGDRDGGGDQKAPSLALACEVVLRDLVGDRPRWRAGVGSGRSIADVVAGGFDGADEGRPIGDLGQVVDGRHLGGEVDGGRLDAGRLPQEALDAVDAGRAGHPLDGKGEFGGRGVVSHTPWEYTTRPPVRDSGDERSCRHLPQHPRSVGSVLRRRDRAWRGRRRLADDRGRVPGPPREATRWPDRVGRRGSTQTTRDVATSTSRPRLSRHFSPAGRPRRSAWTWRTVPAWDRHVLDEVAAIPFGSTASYGDIARRVGAPRAARAVGGAVGRNPIGLLIPCHRVIAADGTIGGYGGDAWGSREDRLDIKRALLRREGVEIAAGG